MNRKLRFSLLIFIALSIAGLAVLVFIHYRTNNVVKVTFTEDKKFGVQIEKVHYSGSKGGHLEWELDAATARRSKDEDTLELDEVKLTFYAENGAPIFLTAKKGAFTQSAGEVTVTGDVAVDAKKNGYMLTTESLKYSLKTKKVSTDDRVRITSKEMKVEGVGLAADIVRERFRLLKDVHAVF